MLSLYILYLFFAIIYCQSTIRIGIIDDNNSKESIDINLPNITFCNQKGLNLQLYWINTFNSLPNLLNKLELEVNLTNIYLTYTDQYSTKLIENFCQINHIPFFNMKSNENNIILCSLISFVF